MSEEVLQCYTELYHFLGNNRTGGSSVATYGLAKLSPPQINELVFDIYCDLSRRQGRPVLPPPSVDSVRIAGRNQIAQLSNGTFKELVEDMCAEFERRSYY